MTLRSVIDLKSAEVAATKGTSPVLTTRLARVQ